MRISLGELVQPFKDNHCALVVGTITTGTSGQPYHLQFDNGMSFHISTERLSFPDGKEFEGIDIRPDVESELPIDDLRQGQDLVFDKAMELALKP